MSEKSFHRLGDLQLRIMKVLWNAGPSTVTDVQQRLDGEPLAYTTVATMLRKMEQRRLVQHRADGRRFLYEAVATADEVTRDVADNLLDQFFEGSLAGAVRHLLRTREVDPAELDDLERMIHQRRRAEESPRRADDR